MGSHSLNGEARGVPQGRSSGGGLAHVDPHWTPGTVEVRAINKLLSGERDDLVHPS